MSSPVEEAIGCALGALTRAARRLDCPAAASSKAIRFRADGKGGELASPFPMAAGLDSAALAAAVPETDWIERVYPSGGWLAFDLSEAWRESVRRWNPAGTPLSVQAPPVPEFPARIDPDNWRLDALAGITDPLTAARLDRGNPAVLVRLARKRSGQNGGDNRPDRLLVNEAAWLYHQLCLGCAQNAARQLIRLARTYLARPGEDALIRQCIQSTAEKLGI